MVTHFIIQSDLVIGFKLGVALPPGGVFDARHILIGEHSAHAGKGTSTLGIDFLDEGMEVIRQQGRRVPEDVAVIGYDDLSIAALNNPSLTTVSQHINQAGRLLAENLLNQLETGVVSNVTLPVDLVKRQSA